MGQRSLRLGAFAGAEIWLHWSLLLLLLYVFWMVRPRGPADLLFALVLFALLCISVALHELGHVVAAHSQGIQARGVVLWAVGGLTTLSRPASPPRAALIIYAAGPLVNLLLAGLIALWQLLMAMFGGPHWALDLANRLDSDLPLQLAALAAGLGRLNLLLGLINLIPVYPLDGGQIGRALLEIGVGIRWANRLTLAVSLPLAGGYALFAAGRGEWINVATALLIGLAASLLYPPWRNVLNRGIIRLSDRPRDLLLRGDYQAALAACEDRIARDPSDALAYHNRGAAYLGLGQLAAAEADLRKSLAIQPDQAKALTDLAYVRALAGAALAEVRAGLGRALEIAPASSEVQAMRVNTLVLVGEYADARAGIDELLLQTPGQAALVAGRAMMSMLLGDYPAALEGYRSAHSLEPREPRHLLGAAAAQLRLCDLPAASATLDRALALAPASGEAHLQRGLASYLAGDRAAAQAAVERAVGLDGEQVLTHDEVWLRLHLGGRAEWARCYYGWASAARPELAAAAHSGLADALRGNGLAEEALGAYGRAIELEPARAGAYAGRGLAQRDLGQIDLAQTDLERARELGPPAHQRRAVAAALRELGELG